MPQRSGELGKEQGRQNLLMAFGLLWALAFGLLLPAPQASAQQTSPARQASARQTAARQPGQSAPALRVPAGKPQKPKPDRDLIREIGRAHV